MEPDASPADSSHQCPEVRHGPALSTTAPPLMPRRSGVRRMGRPSCNVTRAGTGKRKRRKATEQGLGTRGSGLGKTASALTAPTSICSERVPENNWSARLALTPCPSPEPRVPSPAPSSPAFRAPPKGFISNAPGRQESTRAGEPTCDSPMRALRRAMSVETCSVEGCARSSSDHCTMRPGVGSTRTTTRSMAAVGGCDSRSSRMSVRSVFGSRMGAGSCSVRVWVSRVVRRSSVCSTAAPRSARSRRTASGSSTRPSTNESGSRPSIGHSSSSEASNGSSGTSGTSGARSSPRAACCQRGPSGPRRDDNSTAGRAAKAPSVRMPQRRSTSRA